MIISRSPFKISFFGGGTDFPVWYRENGGSVLGTTINKYCYITSRYLPPFFDYRYRVVYSRIELAKEISEIQHPAVREVLKYLKINENIEIHHDGDLPARSGIGAKAAFAVGLLNALNALTGKPTSREKLATDAIHLERTLLSKDVGSQDQIMSAFGGLNRIDFKTDDTFKVTPINLNKEKREMFEQSMMLFYMGLPKPSFVGSKTENFKNAKTELSAMGGLVDEAVSILSSAAPRIDEFGKLLNESWELKKTISGRMSDPRIEDAYQTGLSAGALGGKLLGSGGGGFLLFIVKPESRTRIQERMGKLLHVGFNLDTFGSRIVAYSPQNRII
jgi:D-glycero-alpha-D-manno-heptose-7-phosphate kinase